MCRGDEYDLGYTELMDHEVDHEVTGSKHAYEQARMFQRSKEKKWKCEGFLEILCLTVYILKKFFLFFVDSFALRA